MSSHVRIFLEGRAFDCAPGQRLIDIIDEFDESLLPVECRASHCGSCRVRVTAGAAALDPPNPDEQHTLEILQAGSDERLGCQLVIHGVVGSVTLERVSP